MRIEKFVDGKFSNLISAKDGYVVPDCKNVKARWEKPTRITVAIGNTIFGVLYSDSKEDWALVLRDTMKRLLTALGKSRASPICPFVFHLYITYNAIRPEDKKVYMVEESMLKHNIEPDEEDKPAGTEDFERQSLDAAEIAEVQT